MKTAKGIYLDLKESDYKYKYKDLEFYFSSIRYLEKFKENVENFINEETVKLELKYHIVVDFKKYLAIAYYKRIERRGFRVKEYNLEFNENMKIKNYLEK